MVHRFQNIVDDQGTLRMGRVRTRGGLEEGVGINE